MRGTVAKRLRKKVYGDLSTKTRKYNVLTTVKKFFTGREDDEGNKLTENVNKNTIFCTDTRMVYQQAKKEYYKSKRG
jgi:hypothetical protein